MDARLLGGCILLIAAPGLLRIVLGRFFGFAFHIGKWQEYQAGGLFKGNRFALSPDGRLLVFTDDNAVRGLWIIKTDGT